MIKQKSKPPQKLTWLRLKYRFATVLEAPFGDVFWFFHQRAARLQDEIERQGCR
jgi:hypothetical protein